MVDALNKDKHFIFLTLIVCVSAYQSSTTKTKIKTVSVIARLKSDKKEMYYLVLLALQ